jgi:plastocyanin
VNIQGFAFVPATLSIDANTQVTWTNTDTASHTATADDGSFDSGTLASHGTATHLFTAKGTYTYHCSIHSSMTATVTVH